MQRVAGEVVRALFVSRVRDGGWVPLCSLVL